MINYEKSKEELNKELNNLKDKIFYFKKYLDDEANEYAKSMSAINIEASVIDDVSDKFNEIFTLFDY